MLADLDLLLIAVFCAADDLLPKARNNAKRIVTDAEVITLCVAQAIMGITSDPRFLAVARKRLIHLFPVLPDRAGFYKRREALSDTIEALIAEFAALSPGAEDDVLLVDSTPVECARSRETVKRGRASSLADALSAAADYGYCASHSRFFYVLRIQAPHAVRDRRDPPRDRADLGEGRRERRLSATGRTLPPSPRPVPDPDRR